MDLTVKTPATLTAIDKALVKASKRITHASEDDLIDFCIKSADDFIEKGTNRALMEQTLLLRLGRVLSMIELPRPPLLELLSIKYTPEGGGEVTIDVADVIVATKNMLGLIFIPDLEEASGTMEIEFKAGATDPSHVPQSLRQAALLLTGHWLSNREATVEDSRLMKVDKKIQFGVDQLIRKYLVPNADVLNGGY